MKVIIAGFGNMGRTYAESFISSRFIRAQDMVLLVRDKSKAISIHGIPETNFTDDPTVGFVGSDIVILAVKPQDFGTLADQIKPFIKDQIVLSIMAGVKIATISEKLGSNKIVRAMPNIPTQIGMGMTVFTASPAVDRKELFIIQNLINTTGKSVYVENETLINAATAISGSGPAYVFYFMQSMINAAMELGFSESEAELLVNQTFIGSVSLQNSSALSNGAWISKVASKGGTTESALRIFGEKALDKTIVEALHAANTRATELGS